jgi:hypothetical protein
LKKIAALSRELQNVDPYTGGLGPLIGRLQSIQQDCSTHLVEPPKDLTELQQRAAALQSKAESDRLTKIGDNLAAEIQQIQEIIGEATRVQQDPTVKIEELNRVAGLLEGSLPKLRHIDELQEGVYEQERDPKMAEQLRKLDELFSAGRQSIK